tara:strand:- start:24772 stop:25056 length:285 start_codon:yes stop_codon:yes gene_type:complete
MGEKIIVEREAVRHVSELSKIDLDEKEVEIFTKQFEDIISYFEILEEVPEVEIQSDIRNILRKDEETESLRQNEIFQNSEGTGKNDYFKGPKVR